MNRYASLALLLVGLSTAYGESIPDGIRERLQLDPFYQQYVDAGGLPIIGSSRVDEAALQECGWIVRKMLSERPDLIKILADEKVRFVIMAHDEYTTDLPEQRSLEPKVYWDRRARGLGATPWIPVVSGGEENLLAFPGDPYPTEIIPLHEFAHAIHMVGLAKADPTFDARLQICFDRAIANGLWKDTYAAVNAGEYWAECVQCWFGNNAENNSLHNSANTRAELLEYDPSIAALCQEVFGQTDWKYETPEHRHAEDRKHLATLSGKSKPTFRWRAEPVPENPKIQFDTPSGEFKLELNRLDSSDSRAASPSQVSKFLEQVQQGWFSSGHAVIDREKIVVHTAETLPSGTKLDADPSVWTIFLGGANATGPTELEASILSPGTLLRPEDQADVSRRIVLQRLIRLN